VRVAKDLTGLDVEAGAEVLTIRHAVTRYRITMVCVEAALLGGQFTPGYYAASEWLTPGELGKHPLSTPQRKLMRELEKG
jgi:A/G-specific adenine glycosylase